jgi:predicted ATPase/serine/threonine protein kinase
MGSVPSQRKTNVAAPATSFIGRDDDLSALHDELRQSRLVTIAGPPGAGKSRLALEYVLRHGAAFLGNAAGGAWLCDLSRASELDDLVRSVAALLEVSLADARAQADPAGHLGSVLVARGPSLLVLDNFEQLVSAAAPAVARWLRAAPELSVIVTSRVRLGLPGETCFELGGLELPDAADRASVESDALRLFVERARAARRDFAPSDAERAQIAELVSRLDGLPLAIELAGARMGVLGPKQLLERLGKSLDILRGSAGRASTLRVTLDWSWKLLSAAEQDALAQAALFHGGFSLEAAEAVIDLSRHDAAPEVVDALEALRNSSLLRCWALDELPGELRFGLLEIVRVHAEEKLAESGHWPAAAERHARYFETLGAEWQGQVERSRGPEFLRRLALALPNLSAVHRRALSAPAPSPAELERALRIALSVEPVFYMRGPTGPCLSMLDEVFAHPMQGVDPRLVALALKARGRALRDLGRSEESRAELERALEIARKLGDRSLEARVLGHVGFGLKARGQTEEALSAFLSARDAAAQAGDRRTEGMLEEAVGAALSALGRLDQAAAAYDQALLIHDQIGNRYSAASTLALRAEVSRANGQPEAARADLERALQVYAEFGERRHEGLALRDLGILHQEQARFDAARSALERALVRHREFGGRSFLPSALLALAGLEREQAHLLEARRLAEQALEIARNLTDKEHVIQALIALGGINSALGRAPAADQALAEAGEQLASFADPSLARLLEIESGHAVLAGGDRDGAAERLERARAAPIAARPAMERLALRLLARALEQNRPTASGEHTPTDVERSTAGGRYELLVQIASGGMATVFVARQRGAGGFERLVAIKRLHPHLAEQPEFAEAFLNEARLASLVRHPNVVSVQDVHESGKDRLLVMDYVDGVTLAELMGASLGDDGWIPRATALWVLSQVLRGLHAAHEQCDLDGSPLGIVHRDASPHNMLLGADGSVRIADFGIAKARLQAVQTEPGLAKGKFRYMAPEQARADPLDRRADLFSIGVVAWELLSASRMFSGANDLEVLTTIVEPSFCAPALEGPPELAQLVARALEADPEQRWPSALEMARAIEAFCIASELSAREPEVAQLVERRCGQRLAERRRRVSDVLASGRNLEMPSIVPPPVATHRIAPIRKLRAGASGRWFVAPGAGERVSLERRRALRRILKALIDRRLGAPGSALSQEDLLGIGWPGEKVRHDAGMLRVYNALSTLRKLGLRELLLSRDDGYLIDPRVGVERIEEPGCDTG